MCIGYAIDIDAQAAMAHMLPVLVLSAIARQADAAAYPSKGVTVMALREPTPEEREQFDLAQIKQSNSRLFARPISSVMRKLLAEKGYGAVEAAQGLIDVWPSLVGAKLAAATRVGKVSKGVLHVEVNSSLALQEVHFQKSTILKALQTQLPAHKITDLRFRIAAF
jgi:predicted nucleic acid-binding Zn ribbon protein